LSARNYQWRYQSRKNSMAIKPYNLSMWITWNKCFRRIVSSGMLHRVALVRTDVSEERIASFIRVTRIGELGTTLAVTTNRRTVASYS
jgi:hypothetical protein